MEPRYFEYKDKRSSKFWQITIKDKEYITRYGKIGCAGQTRTTVCDSSVEAKSKALTLISRKLDKGYKERNANSPLAKATNKKARLKKPSKPRAKLKKPIPPTKPPEFLERWENLGRTAHSIPRSSPTSRTITLGDLVKKARGIDLNDVCIVSGSSYYNSGIRLMRKVRKPNPNYKTALETYKIKFAQHQKELVKWQTSNEQHEKRLAKYEKDLDEWLKEQDFLAFERQKALMSEKYGEKAVHNAFV